jgi:hypothetical protein
LSEISNQKGRYAHRITGYTIITSDTKIAYNSSFIVLI